MKGRCAGEEYRQMGRNRGESGRNGGKDGRRGGENGQATFGLPLRNAAIHQERSVSKSGTARNACPLGVENMGDWPLRSW